MPSLTWWKTASNTEAPSSTAIAHEAPALPSEIALQKESAVAAPASAVAASPYVSTGTAGVVSPTAYPSTTAPAFDPTKAAPTQVASTAAPASSPNVGSIALPYNPNSVPPAPQTSSTVAQASTGTDRYGTLANTAPPAVTSTPVAASVPAAPTSPTTSAPATSTPATSGLGSRYASTPVSNPPAAPAYTAPAVTTASATSESSGLGDRYASQPVAAAAPSSPPTPSETVTPQPTTVPMYPASQQNLAGAEPYRPGGTSSYPGAAASLPTYNVASRPEEPSENAAPGQEVPNVTTPEATTDPGTQQRYW